MKAVLSLALMAVLIWQIDLRQLLSAFAATHLPLCAVAFALFLFQQVVVAYAWQIPLAAHRSAAPFAKTLEVHFIGSFFGTFLPSSVAMDVIRAYRLGRYLARGVDSASAMFVTRVAGFLMNFLLALLVAIPVSHGLHDLRFFWLVLGLTLVFVAGLVIVLHPRALEVVRQLCARFKLTGLVDSLAAFRQGILFLARARRPLAGLIAVSFCYQIMGIVIVYLLGRALAIPLEIWHYFIYIPLITTVTLLPISLAGIGVREGAFVFFFAQAGVAQAQALSLSLLLFAQSVALALIGGAWYLFAREAPAARQIRQDHSEKLSGAEADARSC